MQSREEDSSKAKTIIKIEDTEENGVVAQADSGPPTLEKMLAATLDHLLAVFKGRFDPQHNAWHFYQSWLIVNNTDYKDSPFFSFSSAKSLFVQ
ncbi:MAG: hypothetical protein Q9161_004125 [Pseudevernia consocians]